MVAFLELLTKPQGVQTQVSPDDRTICDRKEVAELAGPATNLEYADAQRDLFVKQFRKNALPCLFQKAAYVVELVIIRKRSFFVERLNLRSHVSSGRFPFIRPIEERDAVRHFEAVLAAATLELGADGLK